jgi:HTH-type transcriptional regulator/antitoxin HipB
MQFNLQTIDQLKPLIQGFRKRAGLTQADMAARLGITQQSYAQIESNLNTTSVERLYVILRLLNVHLSFLPIDAEADPKTQSETVQQNTGPAPVNQKDGTVW